MKGNLGEIRMFAGDYVPKNWMPCTGQTLQIASNMSLFATIENTFGGDGKTTFMLPNLQDRAVVGLNENWEEIPRVYLSNTAGQDSFTLSSENMPAHNHTIKTDSLTVDSQLEGSVAMGANSGTANSDATSGAYPAALTSNANGYCSASAATSNLNQIDATKSGELTLSGDVTLASTGSATPTTVDNHQPCMKMNYIICVDQGTDGGQSAIIGSVLLSGAVHLNNGFPAVYQNTMVCNGDPIMIQQNSALQSVIGNTYGQATSQNFFIPDLQGRSAVQQGTPTKAGMTAVTLGEKVGSPTLSIGADNLPAHTHTPTSTLNLTNNLTFSAAPAVSHIPAVFDTPYDNNLAKATQFASTSNASMAASKIAVSGSVELSGSLTSSETGVPTTEGGISSYSPYIGVNMGIVFSGITPSNAQNEGTMGEIRLFAGSTAPAGWEFCKGQLLSINSYSGMFEIFDTLYGGDGRSTFALPDLRGCIPVGVDANNLFSELGKVIGHSETTLKADQLPAHTHTVTQGLSLEDSLAISVTQKGSQDAATENSPVGNYFAKASGEARYIGSEAPTNAGGVTPIDFTKDEITFSGEPIVEDTGSAKPFSNFMPGLGLNYIICMVGVFPSRG